MSVEQGDEHLSLQAGRTLIEVHLLRGVPELVRLDVHMEADHGDEDDWTTTDLTQDQARALGEALLKAAGHPAKDKP